MRKNTLKSNYNFISLLETVSGVSQNCEQRLMEMKGVVSACESRHLTLMSLPNKRSHRLSDEMHPLLFFLRFPPHTNIVLCKLKGPDKESAWKLRVLFTSKVKFSFDESIAWKSSAKHFLWARRRGFSLSLSALALSQVVMSQALEEKRQNEGYKTLDV